MVVLRRIYSLGWSLAHAHSCVNFADVALRDIAKSAMLCWPTLHAVKTTMMSPFYGIVSITSSLPRMNEGEKKQSLAEFSNLQKYAADAARKRGGWIGCFVSCSFRWH